MALSMSSGRILLAAFSQTKMWKSLLVEFDRIQPALWYTEGAILDQLHAVLQLEGEDTGHEFWSILCLLSTQQVRSYLVPLGIGGHGGEQVWAPCLRT